MTDLFIKSIKIVHPESTFHLRKCDVSIVGGKLERIDLASKGLKPKSGQERIDGSGHFLSPSFVDCSFWQGEPGNERIEDLESSTALAACSGYGHLMMMPDLNPSIQTNVDVQFFKAKSEQHGVNFIPIARVTNEQKPDNSLTEIMHLADEGVGAFSNGSQAISDLSLFSRVLEYSSMTSKLLMNQPVIRELAGSSVVHSSAIAEQMGLNGLLPQAEYMALQNQLELANYYNIPFLAMNLTSSESVRILKENRKRKGCRVYASVPLFNLIYNHKDQSDFDTNKKLWPVIREESDRKALIKALKEGIIDLIGSNHFPVAEEEKKVEFNYAPFGAISLQLVFPFLLKLMGGVEGITQVVEILSLRPREIFAMDNVRFEVGEEADYCILSKEDWVFNQNSNQSKSSNSAHMDQEFTGKCKALIRNKRYWLND